MKNRCLSPYSFLLTICLLLICLPIVSCKDKGEHIISKGDIIVRYGSYLIEEGHYTIIVQKGRNGILNYEVKNAEGSIIIDSIKSSISASVYHKWIIYWDDQSKWLWIDSSDIGVCVWTKKTDGIYQQEIINTGSPLLENIPHILIEAGSPNIKHKK